MYEVHIEKHWSGKAYNVHVAHFDRTGSGVRYCRAFDVSLREATKEAHHNAKLYNAEIINK